MKKSKSKELNKTEESIFTLLSLYVLIIQAFESLTENEDIIDLKFDYAHHSFKNLMNDTIHESLVYQILLKACAFLDEWNTVFGIDTETNDKELILKIKKIVKPASRCISDWKDLRNFRNQAIAHNHRDRNGKNIYINRVEYNYPQNVREIYLLVYCLKQMINVLRFFFETIVQDLLNNKLKRPKSRNIKIMSAREIKNKISMIDDQMIGTLMRIDVMSGLTDGIVNAASVGIAISDILQKNKRNE